MSIAIKIKPNQYFIKKIHTIEITSKILPRMLKKAIVKGKI
jgi:hypothetical protein